MVRLGLFLLFAGVAGAATCPVQDLGLNASVDGVLAEGDCAIRDVDSNYISGMFVKQYRIVLTDKGIVTIRLSSTAFKTYLYLYNSSKVIQALNDSADGTPNSRITMSLNPGTYLVVASSRAPATGDFNLKISFELPRPCAITDLTPGILVSGTLDTSNCRNVDLKTPSNDERPLDRYRLSIRRRSIVTLNTTSKDFDSVMELFNSQGKRLSFNHAGAGGFNSRITISLDPDDYVVNVTPFVVGKGGYAFVADVDEPRQCPVQDLNPGDSPSGTLTAQSCRYLDLVTPSTDATYLDVYRITVKQRSVVSVDMKSTAFDSYLVLIDTGFRVIFENDDAGPNTRDSRLVGSVEAGTYYLLAATVKVTTGAYTTAASIGPVRSCPPKDLGIADSASGRLVPSSCRVLDLIIPSDDVTLLDPYRMTIDRPVVLTFDMRSRDFSPYLVILDQQGQPRTQVDSKGNPVLTAEVLVPPGTYVILANSADSPGAYTLTTGIRAPKACPQTIVNVQDRKQSLLSEDACAFRDMVPFSQQPAPAERYQVEVTQRGDLTVTVNSASFTPVLFLLDSTNQVRLAADLNQAEQSSAQLTVNLRPGVYNVIALSPSSTLGDYELLTGFTRTVTQ